MNEPARANAWGKADLLRSSGRVMSVLWDHEVERKIPEMAVGSPFLMKGLKSNSWQPLRRLARMDLRDQLAHIYDLRRP